MLVKTFVDKQTFTLTHIAYDPDSLDAIIFDPVLGLDPVSWKINTDALLKLDDFISQNTLKIHYIIDSHVHADHITGMQYLKNKYSVRIVIGSHIGKVQNVFKDVFNFTDQFKTDGSQYDILTKDGDVLNAGSLTIEVLHTPGHTPDSTTYKIDDAIFTGDILFNPDVGTGRCDFPKGSAKEQYSSITEKLYTLPDATKVYPAHDYPDNRELQVSTTILDSKLHNIDLPATISEDDYVSFLEKRDSKLSMPHMVYPSVQVNVEAGVLPSAESNGRCYLKIPLVLE
jgi:glyoxylase-like metal-dependent hydrolase (beta-lactamase superfamily II)